MTEEQRKKKLFRIEVDKLALLHENLKEELEAEERNSKNEKRLDETEEESLRYDKMSKKVKHMKTLSKQANSDPLFQSIAGVLSLYQGINILNSIVLQSRQL